MPNQYLQSDERHIKMAPMISKANIESILPPFAAARQEIETNIVCLIVLSRQRVCLVKTSMYRPAVSISMCRDRCYRPSSHCNGLHSNVLKPGHQDVDHLKLP